MSDKRSFPYGPPGYRVLLVLGGGDWADASVDDLLVPDGLDMQAAYEDWCKVRGPGEFSFPDWLKKHRGCQDANLETFSDE